MADNSQDQRLDQADLNNSKLTQAQAGRDAIVDSQVTIQKSFFALYGNLTRSPEVDWDWADKVLRREMQPEIKKRLKDTVLGGVLSEVDLSEEPEWVARLRSQSIALEALTTLKTGDGKEESIDPRQPILATFARDDIKGKLLILGTPGAGKTTLLLKLAEQLVDEALANPKTVIPIIFELSTWRDDKQSIEAWLIEQLYENFGGTRKRKIYEQWLEKQVLLPLLDGLDELGLVRQQKCTEKINEFAKTYGQLVVCCRVKEFRQAGIKLSNLRGAVQLQPLSDGQIQDYLTQVGKSELWQQIQENSEIRQLLQPRIEEQIKAYLSQPKKQEFWERAIQAVQEIQNILSLDSTDFNITDQQICEFLGSIGKGNLFYLALEANNEIKALRKLIYSDSENLMEIGLLRLPLFLSLAAQIYDSQQPLQGKSDLLEKYIDRQLSLDIREYDRRRDMSHRRWSFKTLDKEPDILIVKQHLAWLAVELQSHQKVDFAIRNIQASWLTNLRNQHNQSLVSKSRLRYQLLSSLIFGLVGGLIFGLAGGLIFGLVSGFVFSCVGGLALGLALWIPLADQKFNILSHSPLEVPRLKSNSVEIRNRLKTSLNYVLIGGTIGALIGGGIGALIGGLIGVTQLQKYLIRISQPIQYFSLRIILTHYHQAPWNLSQFLDYCTERRLLQNMGSKYRFIHRELLDHFAQKYS